MIKKLCISLVLLFATLPLFAANPYTELKSENIDLTLKPLEEEVIAEFGNSTFQTMPMYRAAFIASGITEEEKLKSYEAKFLKLVELIKKENPGLSTKKPEEQAQLILDSLHKHRFKKFSYYSTTFLHILDKGEYNCIGSANFFNSICTELGLETMGTSNDYNHAACLLKVEERFYRVEPNRKRKGVAGHGKRMKSFYNNVEMVASLWGNRSADYFKNKRDFVKAIQMGYRAILLAPTNKHAVNNFQAAYVALANQYGKKKNYDKAIELLSEIQPFFSEDRLLNSNIESYSILKTNQLAGQNRFEEAFKYVESLKEILSEKQIRSMRKTLYTRQALSLVGNKEYEKALEIYIQALKEFPKDRKLLHNFKVSKTRVALTAIKKKDYKKAEQLLSELVEQFPKDRMLKQNLDNLRKVQKEK